MPKQNNKNKKNRPKKEKQVPWDQQTPDQRQATVTKIVEKLKSFEIRDAAVLECKEMEIPGGEAQEYLVVEGVCPEKNAEKLEIYANTIDKILDRFDVSVSALSPGASLPPLVMAYDLEEKEQPILEDRRGKVVVVEFWASWIPKCEASVKKLHEVAVKNEKDWKDKVEFLAVAVDDTLENTQKFVGSDEWKGKKAVQFLWGGESGGDEGDEGDMDPDSIEHKYEVGTVPDMMIIDPTGKLVIRGDPTSLNYEAIINKVLRGEKVDPEEGKEEKFKESSWVKLPAEKQTDILEKAKAFLEQNADQLAQISMVVTDNTVHTLDGKQKKVGDLVIVGKVTGKVAEEKLEALFNTIGLNDIEKTVIVACDETGLNIGSKCHECGTQFDKLDKAAQVRWHCALCPEGYTICDACEKKQKTAAGASTSHPRHHRLFFRVGPDTTSEELDNVVYSIGSFSVIITSDPPSPPEEVLHEEVFCNACEEGPISKQARYKCCSCDDYDLCAGCFNQHVAGKLAKEKEHGKEHIFVKIEETDLVQINGDDLDMDEFDEGDVLELGEGDDDDDDEDIPAPKGKKGRKPTAKVELIESGDEDEEPKGKGKGGKSKKGASDESSGAKGSKKGKKKESDKGASEAQSNAKKAAAVPLPDDDDF